MDVKFINAVCNATTSIFRDYFHSNVSIRKPYAGKFSVQSSYISVIIGVIGDLDGQIICSFSEDTAKKIIGTMMGGVEVASIDDMGWSALQEFGNWVAGTSATEISKVGAIVDVTPPIVNEGSSRFYTSKVFITIPLEGSIGEAEVHVSLEFKN